jgi:uroporphyrin-III C-methyltransferase
MRKLREIAALYAAAGKAELPAAMIPNGSLEEERLALMTVEAMPGVAATEAIGAPGILISGEVVALHPAYSPNRPVVHGLEPHNLLNQVFKLLYLESPT